MAIRCQPQKNSRRYERWWGDRLRFAAPLAVALLLLVAVPAPRAGAQEPTALATAQAMERLVSEAIQRAEKSVVAISRHRREREGEPVDAGEPTDPGYVPTEFGTGIVIDAKGLIVTNYHVLGDTKAADFHVWLAKKPYPAKVKAADPWLDLAVLQIDADNLQPIPFGDGRAAKKGEFVIALGNPYAIARDGSPSASWGIVSNIQRQAPAPRAATRPGGEGRETLHHWGTLIQTDARLELGASGGALLNLKGELIGMTTSLAALYGYERPGGFAIPVDDDFRRALEVLKRGQLPEYGFLGVAPTSLTAAERRLGRFGALVEDVVPATPAAAAGLKPDDLVTHFDGEPVRDDLELIRHVSGRLAGSEAVLSVERAGRSRQISVTLSKKPLAGGRTGFAETPPPVWRGLAIDYATAAPLFREQNRNLDPAGCVGVLEVVQGSAAWKAGLRPGDFISHVEQKRVARPEEFHAAVAGLTADVAIHLTAVEPAKALRTVPPEMP